MSEYVMICRGWADGRICEWEGFYLKSFTPFDKIKGEWTPSLDEAKKYPSLIAASEEWRFAIGTRPDSRPDRPLTAFSIEILPVERIH